MKKGVVDSKFIAFLINHSQYTVEGGHSFTVDVIDPCTDYVELMKAIFNFDQGPNLLKTHKTRCSIVAQLMYR